MSKTNWRTHVVVFLGYLIRLTCKLMTKDSRTFTRTLVIIVLTNKKVLDGAFLRLFVVFTRTKTNPRASGVHLCPRRSDHRIVKGWLQIYSQTFVFAPQGSNEPKNLTDVPKLLPNFPLVFARPKLRDFLSLNQQMQVVAEVLIKNRPVGPPITKLQY